MSYSETEKMTEDAAAEFAKEVLECEEPGEWDVTIEESCSYLGWVTFRWVAESDIPGDLKHGTVEEYIPGSFRVTVSV